MEFNRRHLSGPRESRAGKKFVGIYADRSDSFAELTSAPGITPRMDVHVPRRPWTSENSPTA
jgi:hypothetical protein